MPELTDAQIAALPEEWQKMAHDTTRIRQALGLVYDPFHEIRLSDQEDLLAAFADATLRAEQTALQPGQVAVDETLLRMIVQQWADRCHCTSPCPLYDECDGAPDPSDDTNEDSDEWREATAEYCAGRLLQRFGLEVE